MNDDKNMIINLIKAYFPRGEDRLLHYLTYESDFFVAPCSTHHHLACPGGLAKHSLSVLELTTHKVQYYGLSILQHHVIISALMHDLCKANYYAESLDVTPTHYYVKDQHPYGHGEASVIMLQRFIQVPDEVVCAIRWHMGAWTPGLLSDTNMLRAFNEACKKYPLVPILISADYEAMQLKERDNS